MAVNHIKEPAKKILPNLDWTRDPVPSTVTHYQQYIREFDWSKTGLGPIESWRRELRQTILFMMAEVNPVILYWGDHCTMIYNEAYVPLIGQKHPQAQGMNAPEVFPDFWDYFDQIIDEQRYTGETRVGDASMLMMERHGFLEETYFDWKLIPVIGDDGIVLGSYGRPTESTNTVINSRRNACIHSLTQQISGTKSFVELWKYTTAILSSLDKDIPMAMLYSLRQHRDSTAVPRRNSTVCRRESVLGISEDHACAKLQLDLHHDLNGIAPEMLAAIDKRTIHVSNMKDTGLEHLFGHIEWRGHGIPSKELVFLPIKADRAVAAILVLGLNPYLRFTNEYLDFIQLLGDVISAQTSRLLLAEEVDSREKIAQVAVEDFQKSETKFLRLADRSPLGLTLADRDGKVLYANKAWYDFCGLNRGQRESLSWFETVYEEDVPILQEWWYKTIALRQSGTIQIRSSEPFVSGNMRLPCKTGVLAIYPDLDGDGDISSIMGLVTDISELKWAEEQLLLRQREVEESEKKYRNFAEHAPIGVVRTDTEGYVKFANATWRSFYNFDQDQQFDVPQPWVASLNKEDAPGARDYFKELASSGGSSTIEVRLQRRKTATESNGAVPSEFWLLATGFAEYNPDGSISDITFWVTDISDQKAAEKVITQKMEEAIRLKNTQERFVDMISHEIRNPLSAILHCGEEIVDAMKRCLTSVEPLSPSEFKSQDEVQEQPPMISYVESALDAANTIMYCVQHQKQIVDDVLTLSKLDADLLVVSPVPVQPTELVKSALKIFEPELKASSIQLAFEISPSLDELDVDWIMLDPNRFLQIVINLVTNAIKFTRTSKIRRIVISVSAQNNKPPQQHQGVHYVPRREAGRNNGNDDSNTTNSSIVENGIDQTSSSSIPNQMSPDLYLCFSVADTGKGLSDSECTTLFNRFAQASPKTHIEYGGSGLGLFISRQITEMLGGQIGVGSEPGKGAIFAFYVRTRRAKPPRRASLGVESVSVYTKTLVTPTPGTWVTGHSGQPLTAEVAASTLKKGSSATRRSHRPVLPTPEPTIRKRRVLVVEDNLINQKVLCKQLRNRGFTVDAANHGREALDILKKGYEDESDRNEGEATVEEETSVTKKNYDVILCDIEMPIMDGIECVTEIRRLEKEGEFTGHVPIIGVTANVRSKQVNTAIEVGMDGVTTKPYRIDELIAHIDRVSADVKTSKNL